jgi:transposase
MSYSFEQQLYAVSWFVVTNNLHESAREYKKKYGESPPDVQTISRWKDKIISTGSLKSNQPGQGRPATATGDEGIQKVFQSVAESSRTSERRISKDTGISKTSVHRIIKQSPLRKWKPKIRQELFDGDEDRRMQFCEFMLHKIVRDGSFLSNLVFSDEATFHLSGHINRHNCYYYSETDPNVVWAKPVNSPSVVVWAAVGHRGICALHMQRQTMNGDRYLVLCGNKIIPYLQRSPSKICIQDGAPAHYDHRVRECLDRNLPQRWIGRRGNLCEFPPRSPVCDFFLWGYLRELVYAESSRNLDELENKIAFCLEEIPRNMFENSLHSFADHYRECLENNGSLFE